MGLLACALGGAVQYGGWVRLRSRLRSWVIFAISWQVFVLVLVGAYIVVLSRSPQSTEAWVAPAVGLVVGTALPLQAVVVALLRDVMT